MFDFENAVEKLRREVKEAGIEIDTKLSYINSVAFVRPDGIPVVSSSSVQNTSQETSSSKRTHSRTTHGSTKKK